MSHLTSLTLLRFMLRRHWLAITLCSLVPIIIGIVIGLLYPTFSAQRAMLEMFKGFAKFFGQDQMDLFSPEGACSFPFQHPMCLVVTAVIAAIAPTALPAGERGTRGLDVLLATPLLRRQLVGTVIAFGAGVAVLFGLAGFTGAMLAGLCAGELQAIHPGMFLLAAANSAALCGFFGALALVISVMARDRGQAALIFGAVVTVALVVDVIARMWNDGKWLRFFTPFGYLRPADIVSNGGSVAAGVAAVGVLLVGSVTLGLAGWWMQARRRSA